MNMEIGKKIGRLRRENAVTQEMLAEHLGLTAQAVSRWENGNCYPDIELLPALAEFFGVTTDELLCVDNARAPQRIRSYLEHAESLAEAGRHTEAAALMRTALAEYPNSTDCKLALAEALIACRMPSDETAVREACAIAQSVLKSTAADEAHKGQARSLLCTAYTERLGREDKSEEIIAGMASWNDSRELFSARYRTGEAVYMQLRQNLKWLTDNVWSILMRCCKPESTDISNRFTLSEKLCVAEKALALLELIFDGDYNYYGIHVCETCKTLAVLHMQSGHTRQALNYLEKASEAAAAYDARPEEDVYSCVLLRGVPYRRHQYKEHRRHSERYYLKELLENDAFLALRGDERFRRIAAELSDVI